MAFQSTTQQASTLLNYLSTVAGELSLSTITFLEANTVIGQEHILREENYGYKSLKRPTSKYMVDTISLAVMHPVIYMFLQAGFLSLLK